MTEELRESFKNDKTRLSYWFPKLRDAGLPVPKTEIVEASEAELRELYGLLDGEPLGGPGKSLIGRMREAADRMGYPCFLRTDHTSGKHEWESTCFIANGGSIASHAANIVNFWECANGFAPCDVWAIREFLPTMPFGACRNYGNMPICREFRFFVDGPDVKCWHPYWPQEALELGKPEWFGDFDYAEFCRAEDIEELRKLASAAGRAVGGEWSVDILETRRGWHITDMAEARKSYHWEGCRANAGK